MKEYIITYKGRSSCTLQYVTAVSRTTVYLSDDPSKAMRFTDLVKAGRKLKKAVRIFASKFAEANPQFELHAICD